MSADAVAARKAAIYTELNRFVTDGGIAGNDADALQRFNSEREYVSVTIYSSEELELPAGRQMPIQSASLQSAEIRLDSGRGSASPAAEADSDESPETEMVQSQGGGYLGGGMRSYALLRRSESSGKLYPMRFSDGMYYVAITDNSRTREDTMNRIMALVAAVVVLVSVLFWYTNRLTWRVIRLSQETATVGAGDLNGEITVDGRDEIARLAADIDGMRDAVIERMSNEKRAWEANSELITAMSHDIRTPMTSLIGYLGLLNNTDSLSEEERTRYLKAAYGKSSRPLKTSTTHIL
jgi:signal transduction histidine kinase